MIAQLEESHYKKHDILWNILLRNVQCLKYVWNITVVDFVRTYRKPSEKSYFYGMTCGIKIVYLLFFYPTYKNELAMSHGNKITLCFKLWEKVITNSVTTLLYINYVIRCVLGTRCSWRYKTLTISKVLKTSQVYAISKNLPMLTDLLKTILEYRMVSWSVNKN